MPNISTGSERLVEDSNMDLSQLEDSHSSTGRSVPSTPQQTSPQESGPGGEEQASLQSVLDMPPIEAEEADPEPEPIDSPMGPPLNQTTSSTSAPDDNMSQPQSEEEMLEGDDGVSSEGEKPPSGSGEEEGREAEATESPSSNTRSRGGLTRGNNYARRANRQNFRASSGSGMNRGGMNRTPIVWGEQQHMQQQGSPRQGQFYFF